MALSHERGVPRRSAPATGAWLLAITGVLVAAVVAVVAIAGTHDAPSTSSTRGSGIAVTEHREVPPFASVDLAGANTLVIHVGAPLSVSVTGDDNLVGRVTTVVRDGRLTIDQTGSFTTKASMRVSVSAPSLDGVELGGAGTVTVDGVDGDEFTARLAGDGTLVVSGTVRRVTAVLDGNGTLDVHDLVASDGAASLLGTGTIRVNATAALDATLTGTGTILYRGEPVVTTRSTGTGTMAHE